MGAFDNHIRSGRDHYQRWVVGVRFHEPDDYRDVVGDAEVDHRNGAVGMEEINAPAVVVSEGAGLNVERRKSFVDDEKVLPDHPLDVLGIRQRRRSPLGQDAAEELLGHVGVSRLRNHHTFGRKFFLIGILG